MNVQVNTNLFRQDIFKIPKLVLGLIFVSLGLTFSKRSGLGMLPWGVFHTGIANVTGLTFGEVVQIAGVIILVLSIIFVKIIPGIGTIINVILVGFLYDEFNKINDNLHLLANFDQTNKSMRFVDSLNNAVSVFNNNSHLGIQAIYLFSGIFCSSLGAAVYISCRLGAGPRDGLFVGATQMTGISVKYTKPAIELVATITGILLKGAFGVGTIVNALISGYCIHFFFRLLRFDTKKQKQKSLLSYFYKN